MAIPATQLRPGMIIKHNNDLHAVFSVEHRTPGNLRAFIQAKLRNLRSGAMFEYRFRSGDAIEKQFDNGDFKGSVDFVNRLMPEAEDMNHHPDLDISWKTVTVTITTHSEGGLTDGDFELARRIDPLG